jgi:hypothetical protein
MVDLFLRVACHGGHDEPLTANLKRITESAYTRKTLGGVAIEGSLIAPVVAESHDEGCRREIMNHLRECLSESSGKRWQRIYGGMALTESLMQHGSAELLGEVAQGRHFDLVQKVSLLEKFNSATKGCSDRRAQAAVRTKATELKGLLVPMLEKVRADAEAEKSSTCSSKGKWSEETPSTTASTFADAPEPRHVEQIDNAFSALREWLDSADSRRGSAQTSPRSSCGASEVSADDGDWEPLHQNVIFDAHPATPRRLSVVPDGGKEMFFTPMPQPAAATHSPRCSFPEAH